MPDMFHINDWSDLQEKLKDEYNFMNLGYLHHFGFLRTFWDKKENEMKNRMISQMKSSLKDYYNNYIKLRECKEISSSMPQFFVGSSPIVIVINFLNLLTNKLKYNSRKKKKISKRFYSMKKKRIKFIVKLSHLSKACCLIWCQTRLFWPKSSS